jgi:PAS domain S-box-containing protein
MTLLLKLLQVEDSESDGALIVRHLEQAGYSVTFDRVEDEPGMRAALTRSDWDLIVCDYRMPSFDAPSALAVLRESELDIPFLVVSGTIGEDLAVSMMKMGANDYLMKNNLTRLGAAVERELREAKSRAERRHAVEALREREAQLSMAIESTELGIIDHNARTGKMFYSELARRCMRTPAGVEPSMELFFNSLHPEDRPRVEAAVRLAYDPEGDGHYAEEYRVRDPLHGAYWWVSVWGRVLRDGKGAPVRFLGVVRDITEQKRAGQELQFQMQLTACITEQSADCIVLTDLDGHTRFVNPEAERLFGYTFEEFKSTPLRQLLYRNGSGDGPVSEFAETMREREDLFYR